MSDGLWFRWLTREQAVENLDLLVDTKNGIRAMKWWILARFSNQSFTRLMNKGKVSANTNRNLRVVGPIGAL
jgi:hypothetical protein